MDHVTSPPPQTQDHDPLRSLLGHSTIIDIVFKPTPSSFPTELKSPNDTFTCSLAQKQSPDAPPSSTPPPFLGELKKHRLRVSLFVVSHTQASTASSNGATNSNNVHEAPPRKNKEHLLGTFAEASFDFDLSAITPPSSFAAVSSPPVLASAAPSFSPQDFRRLSLLAVLEHRHSTSSNGWKEISRKQTPVFGFSRSLIDSWPSPSSSLSFSSSSSSSLSSTATSLSVSVNTAPQLSNTSFSASSIPVSSAPFSSAAFLRSTPNPQTQTQVQASSSSAAGHGQGQQNAHLSEKVNEAPGLKVPFFFEVNEAQARTFCIENIRAQSYASIIGAQLAPHAISSTTTFFALAENNNIKVQQGDLLILTKEGKITNQLKPINQVSLIVVAAQDYPPSTESVLHDGPALIRVVQSGTCYVNIPTDKYRCSLFQAVLVIYDGEKRKLVASLSDRSGSATFGPLASTNIFFLSPGTNSFQIGCLVTPYFFSEEYITHAAELSQRTASRRVPDHTAPLGLHQSLHSHIQGSKTLAKLSAASYTPSLPSSSSQSYISASSASPSVPVLPGGGSSSLSRSKAPKEQNLAPAHQAPQYASRSFQDQKSPSTDYARRSSNVSPATTFLPSSANPPPASALLSNSPNLVSPFGIPPTGLGPSSSSSSSSSSASPSTAQPTSSPSLGPKQSVTVHGPGSIPPSSFSSASNGQPSISGPFLTTPQSHSSSTSSSGPVKPHNLSQTIATHASTPSRRSLEGGTTSATPKNASSGSVKKENTHLSSTVPILPSEVSQIPSTMDLIQLLSPVHLPSMRRQYGPFRDREHMITSLNELSSEHIFLISLTKSGRHSQEFVASTLDERASNPIFKKLKLMVLSTFKSPHNVELRIIQHNPNHPSRLLLEAGDAPASFSVTAQLSPDLNSMEASLKPEHPRRVSFPSATFSLELVINDQVVQKWPCQVYNSRYGPRLVQEHPERTPYSRHPAFLVCTPDGTSGWKTAEAAVDLPKPSRFTNLQDHVSSHAGKRSRDGRVKSEEKKRPKKKKNRDAEGEEDGKNKGSLATLMMVAIPEIDQEDKNSKSMTDVGKDGESESEQHISSSQTLHDLSNSRFDDEDDDSDDYDELDNEDDEDDDDDDDDLSSSRLEITEHPDAPPSKVPALMSSADPNTAVPPFSQTSTTNNSNKSINSKKGSLTPPLNDLTASEGSEAIAALTQLNHSQS